MISYNDKDVTYKMLMNVFAFYVDRHLRKKKTYEMRILVFDYSKIRKSHIRRCLFFGTSCYPEKQLLFLLKSFIEIIENSYYLT